MLHVRTASNLVDADVTTSTQPPVPAGLRFVGTHPRPRAMEGMIAQSSSSLPLAGGAYLEHGSEWIRLEDCSHLLEDFLRTVERIESDIMRRFGALLGTS